MDPKPSKTDQSAKFAIAQERQRLARELHDRALQMLAGARLRLENCRLNLLDKRRDLQAELVALEETIDRTITEIRNVIADTQNIEGLVAGSLERRLKEEIEIFRSRTGFKLDFRCAIAAHEIPLAVEREIYFTLREGLLNAVRHSRATELSLSLSQDETGWRAQLRDNGIGFDPAAVEGSSHYGLKGMKERIRKLGGRFTLHSAPGQGTAINLFVPVQ